MTAQEGKQLRRAEYAAADEYVRSIYEKSAPPYDEETLSGLMAHIHEKLAPNLGDSIDRQWLERRLTRLSQDKPEIHVKPRTRLEWQAIFPRYPVVTEDGFVLSFRLDDDEDYDSIRTMLDKYGLVVVQVLERSECQATIDAMFDEINQLAAAASTSSSHTEDIHPDKSWTWEDRRWPSKHKFLIRQPAFHSQAFSNRVSPRIYQLFAKLWNETKLRVSIDNWGVTRGSQNLRVRRRKDDDEHAGDELMKEDRYRWGKGISPHWDYNPWLWVDEVKHGRNPGYQAVIALNEHKPGMGCHLTLPGGTAFLEQWCREHGCPANLRRKRSSYRPSEDDPIRSYMQEIPLRQGEMIIWSWGQLHATGHNMSNKMRLHQYIRMFPAREVDPFYEEHDRYAPSRVMRQHEDAVDIRNLKESLDPLGRRLLGLEEWSEELSNDRDRSETGQKQRYCASTV